MITGFSERSLYTQAELPEQSCCRLPVWAPVFPEASAWHWEVNKNANPTESPCVPVLKGQGLAGGPGPHAPAQGSSPWETSKGSCLAPSILSIHLWGFMVECSKMF